MVFWEWFWFLMVWGSVVWYALLVLLVGYRGFRDILRLLADLDERRPG